MQIKIGVALMGLGALVYGGWNVWTRTRRVAPVDVVIPVAAGQCVTQRFSLNYNGLYLIEIVAEKAASVEGELAELGAEWSLQSGGQEVKQGSTAEAHSAARQSSGAVRVIGEFNGRAGQNYELRIKFTRDAQELQVAKPRLRVAVSGLAQENLDAASVLLFSIVFICEFFGLILVGIGAWAKKPERA